MSGIYGIYRCDGAPLDPQWLQRMRQAMAYYGPDGGACWSEGSIGMGHLLLQINPEDAFDRQPVRGERGLVACTARLDNRGALLDALCVPASEAGRMSDGHLVGRAFDRWGQQVCTRLEGDWALAAWDAREQKLFLSRDALGNTTLYYAEGKGFIAFASSLKALLAIPGIERAPDYLRLAEVLVGWQHDAELTAYKGLRRLPWAHAITVAGDGRLRVQRYWSAEGREPLRFRRDDEYVEAFLELYTRAVAGCLRSRKPVAAELSGGRDSGSVVALAAPLLAGMGRNLDAFTSVPLFDVEGAGKQRLGNEWGLAHATATMAGANVVHHAVDARNHTVLQGIEYALDAHDGPGHAACNHYWMQAIAETVSGQGCGVLLAGYMGNATVSWAGNGSALLALAQGQRATALRLFLHAEPNPWQTLKRQVAKPLVTPARRLARRLARPFGSPWQAYSALNPRMAREIDLDGRMRRAGHDATWTLSPLADLRGAMLSPDFGVGANMSSEIGARHSIAVMDPTANLAMVEYLLQVPDDQFCRGRRSPWLHARAFRGRMPDAILDSPIKGLQAADIGHRIRREIKQLRACFDAVEALPEAQALLDLPLMRRCLDDMVLRIDPETTRRTTEIMLRGLGVGLFLQRFHDSRIRG